MIKWKVILIILHKKVISFIKDLFYIKRTYFVRKSDRLNMPLRQNCFIFAASLDGLGRGLSAYVSSQEDDSDTIQLHRNIRQVPELENEMAEHSINSTLKSNAVELPGYKEGPHPIVSDSLFSLIIFIYVSVTFSYMFYAFCWRSPEVKPPSASDKELPMITEMLKEVENQEKMKEENAAV